MAKAVEIRGLGKFQRFLLNLAPKTRRGIVELTETTGRLTESEMKSLAKVDTGKMRQSISYEPTLGGLGAALSVNVAYWAYIEFGTGGEVDIPLGFEDFAAQFRGQGKRTVNIPPQPFVIPVYMKYQKVYYERVERLLNNILRW